MSVSFDFARRGRSAAALTALFLLATCDSANVVPEPEPVSPIPAGEVCFPPQPEFVRLRWEPRFVVLATGQKRRARLVVDPDFCEPTAVQFISSDDAVVSPPFEDVIDYGKPTVELELEGSSEGTATVTASVGGATAELPVEVKDNPAVQACTGEATNKQVAPGGALAGSGTLENATVSLPEGADVAVAPSVVWTVGAFEATIACADDMTPDGHVALSPAVTFGPADMVFPREIPMSLPIEPALLPAEARWRHLRMVYRGPSFVEPRTIPITDARVVKLETGDYRLEFKAHRLGTYQLVVPALAGTKKRTRRITHRAILGVSMGGVGAAQIGLRHHHLFDVVAALGGPVDWTWMMDHIEQHQLGGFRPIAPGTQLADIPLEKTPCTSDAQCAPDETCLMGMQSSGKCTLLPPVDEPYEHAATLNNWWYEPNDGNGSDFDRQDYTQMFRDIAYVYGNPVGYNPLAPSLPAGVDPDHPSHTGNHADGVCKITVKPYDGPDKEAQDELWNQCHLERCAPENVLTLTGYYDDEYNPDGTFPVITVCDGSPQQLELSPWASSWSPRGNDWPVEVALAVDYNANGVRDELEPIIKAGHESWDDWGTDATPSLIEPGYGPQNLDPSGDDYDPQFNPTGTEGDARYQEGEPFRDDGLDGVPGTAASPYDFGEGDGVFTAAPGLERFWEYDPRSMVRTWSELPDMPLDEAALARLDFWTDGGIRDLFNFYLPARHLFGAFEARGRRGGSFSTFHWLPGLDPATPNEFNPAHIIWDDLQGAVLMRYGVEEPTESDLADGTGMHVGTINEITMRLQSALYFIGSRWPNAPHAQFETSSENPAEGVDPCELDSNCEFEFTSSFGRTGPVAVTLPPGYAHADLQHVRYPVIYVLHGYGMSPEDLQAAIVFLRNWMNGNTDSQASRLAKAIIVYVDGRCRWQEGKSPEERAECIRGNFYADSIREDGPQIDAWFLELFDHIDQRFRTMSEATIEWTE